MIPSFDGRSVRLRMSNISKLEHSYYKELHENLWQKKCEFREMEKKFDEMKHMYRKMSEQLAQFHILEQAVTDEIEHTNLKKNAERLWRSQRHREHLQEKILSYEKKMGWFKKDAEKHKEEMKKCEEKIEEIENDIANAKQRQNAFGEVVNKALGTHSRLEIVETVS